MKASDLNDAIILRDAITQIDIFLSGYDGGGWRGPVELKFGSYECTLGVNNRELILKVLHAEREAYAGTLAELGVKLDEEGKS